MTRTRARGFLFVWTGIIMFLVLPWGSFQGHAHWDEIQWLPFISPPVLLRDSVLNTMLYIPLGYWYAKQRGQASLWRTGAFAVALSAGTEFTQIFSHGRFPSATDVTCNVLGAWCGAQWARAQHRRPEARHYSA